MSTLFTALTYHVELIDGREIQKPLPKKPHFLIQRHLLLVFGRTLDEKQYLAGPELNVLCGQDRLVPDLVIVREAAEYKDGDLAEPPVLAVEILSPGQTLSDLFDKCDRLLHAGAPMCWIIWPERRKAWMYNSEDLNQAHESLVAVLLDGSRVEIRLAEMWAKLE